MTDRVVALASPSSALRAPSPTRGEGGTDKALSQASLLPSWEKVARPEAETDEGEAAGAVHRP